MLRQRPALCLICSENACLCWTRRCRGLNCDVAFYCFNYFTLLWKYQISETFYDFGKTRHVYL